MKNKIDKNKYIGINESPISLSKFQNLPEKAKIPGNIFGFDLYGDDDSQFYVVNEKECVILGDADEYVTKEQLNNDKWFVMNMVFEPNRIM